MKKIDVLVIGGGPAGLSAAIYTRRAMLSTVVCERDYMSTGLINESECVENYPGIISIEGYQLGEMLKEHAKHFGAEFILNEAKNIEKQKGGFVIEFSSGEPMLAKAIIYASGASHKKLGIDGEDRFRGRGVSYCAVCDGAFFKDKVCAVIGGGDTAIGDAMLLSEICSKVYVIYRGDNLRATKTLVQRATQIENIEFIYNTVATSILGDKLVNGLNLKNTKSEDESRLDVDGIFIAVGTEPNSLLVKDLVQLDENGYIIADESCKTSCDGIFVAGDVRTKPLRQVVTAVADGACSAVSAEKYIRNAIQQS